MIFTKSNFCRTVREGYSLFVCLVFFCTKVYKIQFKDLNWRFRNVETSVKVFAAPPPVLCSWRAPVFRCFLRKCAEQVPLKGVGWWWSLFQCWWRRSVMCLPVGTTRPLVSLMAALIVHAIVYSALQLLRSRHVYLRDRWSSPAAISPTQQLVFSHSLSFNGLLIGCRIYNWRCHKIKLLSVLEIDLEGKWRKCHFNAS